jgi:hypothetical protein
MVFIHKEKWLIKTKWNEKHLIKRRSNYWGNLNYRSGQGNSFEYMGKMNWEILLGLSQLNIVIILKSVLPINRNLKYIEC